MTTPNPTETTHSIERVTIEAPLPPLPELAEHIDTHRIEYTPSKGGVTVDGSPFYCYFETERSPQSVVETITTVGKPWHLFGIPTRHQHQTEYYSIAGNLIHVEDEVVKGSSKISLEIAPEWVRVYVKENATPKRVAEFVQTLASELGINSIVF
jgi:hypothetical protein